MLYDYFFHLLDSVPTFNFLTIFLLIFILIHHLVYNILKKSLKYNLLNYEKQSGILCNIMEVFVALFITFIGLSALWRKDVSLVNTDKHKPNPQIMINLATMYVVKDVVEIFVNKKIHTTTVIHHVCVVLAYFHVIRVLSTDYNVEGIFKCFIGYAGFTVLNFPYKIYLALRFFLTRSSNINNYCKRYTLYHKLLCVCINFTWQTFYFFKLLFIFYGTGYSILMLLLSLMFYSLLMSAWIVEECVVMDYLRRP